MFPGCLQDFSRMFSGCSDGSYWPGGIWWSFQMKVWTLKIQRNPMIPNYSMVPAAAIWWSPGIRWSPAIDDPQVFDDQLEVWTLIIEKSTLIPPSVMVLLHFKHKFSKWPRYKKRQKSKFFVKQAHVITHQLTSWHWTVNLSSLDSKWPIK